MELVLTALADKLSQLTPEKFLKQIKKDPVERLIEMQRLSKNFQNSLIIAQLRGRMDIPLRVCVESLKAKYITENKRAKVFHNINRRLLSLLARISVQEIPGDWEMIRKVLFIFLDKSSQVANQYESDRNFSPYNPFVSSLQAISSLHVLVNNDSEDLMEIVGVVAQFIKDRRQLGDVFAYFTPLEIENTVTDLYLKISSIPTTMQHFALESVEQLSEIS